MANINMHFWILNIGGSLQMYLFNLKPSTISFVKRAWLQCKQEFYLFRTVNSNSVKLERKVLVLASESSWKYDVVSVEVYN